jgi:hypothetical protein
MIQTSTFRHAKELARYPLGPNGENSYVYWSDVKRQWEESHDSGKIASLIGSQSAAAYKLDDLRSAVGTLSDEEAKLAKSFAAFYEGMLPLMTSLPISADSEVDWLETVVDLRALAPHMGPGPKVLDIGPGAGRHMAALALSGKLGDASYVGLESIGLPYALQNLAGSQLAIENKDLAFHDYLDYQFSHREFPLHGGLTAGGMYHMPFWEAERLPEKAFDVILCTYVLDEIAPDDIVRLIEIIDCSLAPGGVLYCRGSQERAQLSALYLYGYGTYHGHDITKALRGRGLVAVESDMVTDTLTRIFMRNDAVSESAKLGDGYRGFEEDAPMVQALQTDFIRDVVEEIGADARVIVWGDPGYDIYSRSFAEFQEQLDIVGFTQRFAAAKGPTAFDIPEYPPAEIMSLDPDVVIFASLRFVSYYRELRELTDRPGAFQRVRRFTHPVAVAFK